MHIEHYGDTEVLGCPRQLMAHSFVCVCIKRGALEVLRRLQAREQGAA